MNEIKLTLSVNEVSSILNLVIHKKYGLENKLESIPYTGQGGIDDTRERFKILKEIEYAEGIKRKLEAVMRKRYHEER